MNYRGVQKTARLTRVIVAVVLAALVTVVLSVAFGGAADVDRIGPVLDGGMYGTLQAAGLLFFAFAGYARIATLGEEVVDPARTIPKAIPLALGITLVVYAAIAVAALVAVGPDELAASTMPLAVAARAGSLDRLAGAVRIGAAIGSLGVLLSLLAGVSRTAFAMAANGEMPRGLAAVHPRYRVPHRAELAIAGVVIVVVCVADLRGAIGFSSFAVLAYYAVANACAWTLTAGERRWPRALAGAGIAGCLALAVALPVESVVGGLVVLATGAAAWWRRGRRR